MLGLSRKLSLLANVGLGRRLLRPLLDLRGHTPLSRCLSPEELRARLERERDRADRTGQPCALVVLDGPGLVAPRESRERVAHLVAARLRSLDDLGWRDDRRLAVLLSSTTGEGARAVAEALCRLAGAEELPLTYEIFSYPEPQRAHGGEAARASGRPPAGVRWRPPRGPFLRRLPAWKRIGDVVGASVALALAAPVVLLAALAVRLSSAGPVLFRQTRAGLGGEPFTLFKLRTMRVSAENEKARLLSQNEQSGPVFKMKNDPRVTAVGRILRRTSIDELPQLWNVVKGDMSLVGPRPPTLDEVAQYEPWQLRRLSVTPGLTCIWQVNGRAEIGFYEWVRMDIRYSSRRSLLLDCAILLRTLPAVLSGRGAH